MMKNGEIVIARKELPSIFKINGIILNPRQFMSNIATKPDIVAPMILAILSSVLLLSRYTLYKKELLQYYLESPESINYSRQELIKIVARDFWVDLSLGSVVAVIILIGLSLMIFSCVKFLKGKGSFKQIFAISGYAYFFTKLVSVLITLVTSFFSGSLNLNSVPTSITSYLFFLNKDTFIYGFLKPLEIFFIWSLVLLYFGLVDLAGLKKSTVTYLILAVAILVMSFNGVCQIALS